ncbi:hypothetical protein [Cryobacterium sp. CG_9.6]|uniref:hypothetical protein n=1 Tax=Cryobacterium sp. CG_9.6 TaxID=2760710 RepID=UPI002476EC4C|nr:hypothetical protein [Cryobacterium sp. CG_9.6]MDH6237067.1 hypothetical protein [Cryobacterium sp. CG_9.6]
MPEQQAAKVMQTFLGRASKVEDGSVRLVAGSGVLAVDVAVLYPVGLFDASLIVLGLRTFALAAGDDFDVVVPLDSLQQQLSRLQSTIEDPAGPVSVALPTEVHTVIRSAILPPRAGWRMLGDVDHGRFESVAKAGIAEIASAIPAGLGEKLVRRVRTEVWGRPIDGLEHIPAGGAFAAHALGFLAADDVVWVYETGPWARLTTKRGHVLIKRRGLPPV